MASTMLPCESQISWPVPISVATATKRRVSDSMLTDFKRRSRTSDSFWPLIRPEPVKLKSRKPSTLRRVRSRANLLSASNSPAT